LKLPDATDADLAALKQKQDLVELDLEGSRVTDAGLANLMKMKNLLTIGLSGSKVTGAGLENLKTALPNTKIF
jgi:hypothetical protein